MKNGKIIKGIAGFYYVRAAESGVYECKAKGIFRKEGIRPLVGDDVRIEVLDEQEKTGNIAEILPRKNELFRPAAANVDQVLYVLSAASPAPDFFLADRFLAAMEKLSVPAALAVNKMDLADDGQLEEICSIYHASGYPLFMVSAKTGENLDELKDYLVGKTTAAAGLSGVGKSSLTNRLQSDVVMETGNLSRKIERGKNTTRHAQLIALGGPGANSYIMDTPGFGAFCPEDIEKEELRFLFPELAAYEGQCRFAGCRHIHEPGCAVKDALGEGKIHPVRYENYRGMYREIQERKKKYP